MTYFEEDTQLRDILVTGGDALMSQNKTLHNILDATVYRMAVRKRKASPERRKVRNTQCNASASVRGACPPIYRCASMTN